MPSYSGARKRGRSQRSARVVSTLPPQLPNDRKSFDLLSPRGQWHRLNRARGRAASRAQNQRVRREAIEAYGGKCKCCGETEWQFLTIDHEKGANHPMYAGIPRTGHEFYWALRNEGYPRKGFRLLCWNCNNAIGHYGSCPHKAKVPDDAAVVALLKR